MVKANFARGHGWLRKECEHKTGLTLDFQGSLGYQEKLKEYSGLDKV